MAICPWLYCRYEDDSGREIQRHLTHRRYSTTSQRYINIAARIGGRRPAGCPPQILPSIGEDAVA